MATVIGTSGAWEMVVAALAQHGHSISTPRDLPVLLAELENAQSQMRGGHRIQTMRSVQEHEERIAALSGQRGLVKRVVNSIRIWRLRAAIATLYRADAQYSSRIDHEIGRVRSLLHSAEVAGAEAEISVIDQLRTLPPPAVVFNNVRLEATRRIRFDGAGLLSAQIDHVVLTPAGVFVIETKSWSRRFVESGHFHDPFEQVSRANYLCYDLLRKSFGKVRVRSIIASVGSLPDAPPDRYVKVIRPEDLPGYISWFRDVELTVERVSGLHRFFEDRVMSARTRDRIPGGAA